MKKGKITAVALSAVMLFTAVFFTGCGSKNDEQENTQPTTLSEEQMLEKEIADCIDVIVKADKTKALEDELKKYPDYYINSDMGFENLENFKKCIEENFYTVDTEYHILSVKDITDKQEKKVEKELLENFEAEIDIQRVAKVEVEYKYTNYSDKNKIDDSSFIPTTEYYIQFDNVWYYGWGLDLNTEFIEY